MSGSRRQQAQQESEQSSNVVALRAEGTDTGLEEENPDMVVWNSILDSGLFIPEGSVDEWEDQAWDLFSTGLERLGNAEQELVWKVLQAREDEAVARKKALVLAGDPDFGPDTEPDDSDPALDKLDKLDKAKAPVMPEGFDPDKDVYSMTDEEWAFYSALDMEEYEALMLEQANAKAEAEDEDAEVVEERVYAVDPEEHCSCSGPGSKKPKFSTHTPSCPCYQKEWDQTQWSGGSSSFGTAGFKSKTCKHPHQPFTLEEGLVIHGSADRDTDPEDEFKPDLGLYFYDGWLRGRVNLMSAGVNLPDTLATEPLYPIAYLRWTDYSSPSITPEEMQEVTYWVIDEMQSGRSVEVGCMGGHGRTGTFLALVLESQGLTPLEALNRVWQTYCIDAIESRAQVDYMVDFYEAQFGDGWRQEEADAKEWDELVEKYFPNKTYSYTPGGAYDSKKDGKKSGHGKWFGSYI